MSTTIPGSVVDSMISDRVPPHDLTAEQSLLGSMMLSSDACSKAALLVTSHDFYRPAHGIIFDAILALRDKGEAVDAITVAAQLDATGKTQAAGGKAYLLEVNDATPIAANVGEYARIVKRTATLRAIIKAGTDAVSAAYGATEADDVLSASITSLLSLQQDGGRRETSIADAVRSRLAEYRNPTDTLMLPGSGVRIHYGDLTIIGGRPGTGKTAYMVQSAEALSVHGRKCAVLSYEMDVRELADRLISRAVGQPSDFAYDGLSEFEAETYESACRRLLANNDLILKQSAGMTESQIAAFVRSFAAAGGRVVFLDYVQIAADSRDGEYADLTRLIRLLQTLAKSTGVAIVALSQYSREGASSQPRLSNLRGSGALEQEAANAGLMWTPDDDVQMEAKQKLRDRGYLLDVHDDARRLVRIHWAKVRHGETRTEYFLFDGARMHFEPLDREAI